MFVYQIDGTIKQVNVKSTLDVQPCRYSQPSIAPALTEGFTNKNKYNTGMVYHNYSNNQYKISKNNSNQIITSNFEKICPQNQYNYLLL